MAILDEAKRSEVCRPMIRALRPGSRASFFRSGISAANRTGYPSGANRRIGRIARVPAMRAPHVSSREAPNAVIAPIPVTTVGSSRLPDVIITAEAETGVLTAKSERVRERHSMGQWPSLIRDVVQVALGIRIVVVDGREEDGLGHAHQRQDQLDGPCCSDRVAKH